MAHYLCLQVAAGQGFERVYFPLTSPEETREAATDRWLDEQVAGRKRNVAKARGRVEARIEDSRICHPTSWYRENQLGAFAPAGSKPKRRRRRS